MKLTRALVVLILGLTAISLSLDSDSTPDPGDVTLSQVNSTGPVDSQVSLR